MTSLNTTNNTSHELPSTAPAWAVKCDSCKNVVAAGFLFPECNHTLCYSCCSFKKFAKYATCKACNKNGVPVHTIERQHVNQPILKILLYCGSENYNNHCRAGIALTAAKYGSDYPPFLIDLVLSSSFATKKDAIALFEDYNCLLISTCAGAFQNPKKSGNVVATYSNSFSTKSRNGHGVVLLHFSQTEGGALGLKGTSLQGDFQQSQLHPFTYSTHKRARFEMKERLLPNHPLLKNVESFVTGDNTPVSTCQASPGAVVVATLQDNTPLVAFKQNPISNNMLVALNMYCMANKPYSDECCWNADSNGYELMLNSLVFASAYSASTFKFNEKLASSQRANVYSDIAIYFKE